VECVLPIKEFEPGTFLRRQRQRLAQTESIREIDLPQVGRRPLSLDIRTKPRSIERHGERSNSGPVAALHLTRPTGSASVSWSQQHARDGGVQQRGNEADEQRSSAEPCEVMAALRGQRADAAELNAERGEVRETGESKRRQLVRSLGHVARQRGPLPHL